MASFTASAFCIRKRISPRMKTKGFAFRNAVRDHAKFRYVMIAGPDDLLIELFQCLEPERWQITA